MDVHQAPRGRLSRRAVLGFAVAATGFAIAGCSSQPNDLDDVLLAVPAQNRWPKLFWDSPPAVQAAYRFAVAHPEVLRYIPCFCGCDSIHESNADCYVREHRPDGSVLLDPMSFG